jgi:ribonuclease HI
VTAGKVKPMLFIESTCPKTAKQKRKVDWVVFRPSRKIDSRDAFIFTDGSSLGSFAAVVVQLDAQGSMLSESYTGYEKPTHTLNIGAELNGALLGLSNAPEGTTVVLVSDYLGIGAWLTGRWNVKDLEVAARVGAIREVIRARKLDVRYVHHRGHQRTQDDFTRFNREADRLATEAARATQRRG